MALVNKKVSLHYNTIKSHSNFQLYWRCYIEDFLFKTLLLNHNETFLPYWHSIGVLQMDFKNIWVVKYLNLKSGHHSVLIWESKVILSIMSYEIGLGLCFRRINGLASSGSLIKSMMWWSEAMMTGIYTSRAGDQRLNAIYHGLRHSSIRWKDSSKIRKSIIYITMKYDFFIQCFSMSRVMSVLSKS